MEDIRFDGKPDYKIDNVGFVSVLRNENFTFEYKKGKEKLSFIFVESGEIEYHFKNSKQTLKINKGNVLFVPKNLAYKAKYLKNNTIIKIIQFDIASDSLPEFLKSPMPEKSPDFSRAFASITRENMRNTIFLSSKVYELLYFMQNNELTIPKKYNKIIPAVNEIRQMYFENKKLSYYADMCSMSESNFRKLFKEYAGTSPIEYRNIIRISEAKKMIDSREFTVTEAAYLTGFNNMSFFYEIYNRLLGK